MRLLEQGALEAALPTIAVPSLHLIGAHSPNRAGGEPAHCSMPNSIVEIHDIGQLRLA